MNGKKPELRTYERQIKLSWIIPADGTTELQSVHNQIKKFAVPHWPGTIKNYLAQNWMSYYRYSQSRVRGGLPISYVIKLHNLGIVFDDSVLQIVFPWSKG